MAVALSAGLWTALHIRGEYANRLTALEHTYRGHQMLLDGGLCGDADFRESVNGECYRAQTALKTSLHVAALRATLGHVFSHDLNPLHWAHQLLGDRAWHYLQMCIGVALHLAASFSIVVVVAAVGAAAFIFYHCVVARVRSDAKRYRTARAAMDGAGAGGVDYAAPGTDYGVEMGHLRKRATGAGGAEYAASGGGAKSVLPTGYFTSTPAQAPAPPPAYASYNRSV